MKKLYYIMTLMFITLLASCSQEEMVNKETENNRVSISAELPGDIAATRAQVAIPSTHKLRCIIEVWTKSSNPSLKYREEIAVAGGTLPAFDFALRPGDYTCLMWADIIAADAASTEVTTVDGVTYNHFEDTFYDTSDLNRITIKDADAANLFDTELCDGFYGNLEVKKNATAVDKAMKLTRPFAKLIVKETDAEKFATLTGLTVSFEMPKTFSVATGEPGTEKLTALYNKNFASAGDASQILYAGYVFTPSTGLSLGSSILTFTTAGGKAACEIPEESIVLKRNQQMTAGGKLMGDGVLDPGTDPDPEPSDELKVGDYFFIDGTWSSELTEENKANCVGIVYAVGAQPGDDISDYPNSGGKSIKGYVMALKTLNPDFEVTGDHGYKATPPRLFLYHKQHLNTFTAPGEVDKVNHNGYKKTEELLSTELFKSHSTDEYYPALQCFNTWKNGASLKPAANTSDWYLPSAMQVLSIVGGCYGFDTIDGIDGMEKIEALSSALKIAISMNIADNIGGGSGYYVFNTSLNTEALSEPVAIQVKGTGELIAVKNNRKNVAGYVRPVLTIIQ